MKVANLETILLEQDLTQRADLYCLSCRRRLASVTRSDRFNAAGLPELTLSISLMSEHLLDFQQSRNMVSLACGCGIRSTYHLLA